MSFAWFPAGRDDQSGWRLDIVSLLAVIGESTVSEHAQTITASWLCVLPRLIPAPQALLKSSRPKRLPPTPGVTVVGAFSGSKVDELNFAANLIHDVSGAKKHSFQEFTIRYRYDESGRTQTRLEKLNDVEKAQGSRNNGRLHGLLSERGLHETRDRLEARDLSPLNMLTVVSFLISVGLLVWAIILRDGVAALAITTLSLASSATGFALKWKPELAKRTSPNQDVPKGDVVLKLRDAAFVVVHCDENITREIYIGSDSVKYYFGSKASKAVTGLGTLFLMVGVILLGNCTWTMQAAIASAFLVLNGTYWMIALLPLKLFWHVAAYRIDPEPDLPVHVRDAHETVLFRGRELPDSYTRTIWYTIHRSRSTTWVWSSASVPDTPAWREWVEEAAEHIDDSNWDAVERKDVIMTKYKRMALKQEEQARERIAASSMMADKTAMNTGQVAVKSF
ncbi:hypothetical protein CAC42_2866 [Sphaceloma murrayae]|uniref:Uncharacterized protein n=1 Tax=Sphaceloma murrayae TaxID=2082308 RepID=A0A2K1R0W6_9PEZI|nr:hypothetical protein CAC42_2866 [Sphaceloma murrayae]